MNCAKDNKVEGVTAMNMMNVEINQSNSRIEVLVSGEIDAYTAPQLKEAVYPLANQEQVDMVINLSEVSFMDSTGLGIVVGLFKVVKSHNGKFIIIGLSNRLKRLFAITGLAEIIQISSGAKDGER